MAVAAVVGALLRLGARAGRYGLGKAGGLLKGAGGLVKKGAKAAKPNFNPKITKTSLGVGAFFGYNKYSEERQKGHGFVSSAVSGLKEMGMAQFGMSTYMLMQGVMDAPEYAAKGYIALDRNRMDMARRSGGNPFQNAMFDETEGAYTMRQAAMNVMKRNQYNTKMATMGNEAKYMKK